MCYFFKKVDQVKEWILHVYLNLSCFAVEDDEFVQHTLFEIIATNALLACMKNLTGFILTVIASSASGCNRI